MKWFLFVFSVFLVIVLGVSDAFAQLAGPTFNDTVIKIKEDDEGKLIVLKNSPKILYLKYSATSFDSVFTALDNSLAFGSSVSIVTDGKLNVVKAE